MGKVKVKMVMNLKTGERLVDIHADNDDDCDKTRRVIEALDLLFGIRNENTRDEPGGPGQVEAEFVPERVKN